MADEPTETADDTSSTGDDTDATSEGADATGADDATATSDDGAEPQSDERSPRTARLRTVVLLTVAALALVGGGVVVALQLLGDDPDAADGAATLVEVVDDEAGLSISYPESWERLEPADDLARLLVTPNGRDSLLVRSVPLNMSVEADEIEGVRDFTEDLITDGPNVDVVGSAQRVELAGAPGWHYLYQFEDAVSGDIGIHSHYFLFDGDQMIVLVFQALPANRFEELAPTFDQVAESLRLHER